MNKLLVFLGVVSILFGGIFVLQDLTLIKFDLLSIVPLGYIILSGIIVGLGFIRFNKIFGILMFILGGLSLLSELKIIPIKIIPSFILPWALLAIGVRFMIIGFFSGENDA